MKKRLALLPMLAIVALTAVEATASSVGGGIYIPVTATRSSSQCPTGQCQSGATCSHCARLGFACVDNATAPPCSADGSCNPKRATFGHYETKWRRWPGDMDSSTESPTAAGEEEDSLIKAYDPPTPEEEDKHAPLPIEDSVEELPGDTPALEVSLPPLPRPTPGNHPAVAPPNPTNESAPGLPFGLKTPTQGAAEQPFEFTVQQAVPQIAIPQAVAPQRMKPKNSPPSLPPSFTQTGQDSIRRLPAAQLPAAQLPPAMPRRMDSAIRPASAMVPTANGPATLR